MELKIKQYLTRLDECPLCVGKDIYRALLNKRGWGQLGPGALSLIRNIGVDFDMVKTKADFDQAWADLLEYAELYGIEIS